MLCSTTKADNRTSTRWSKGDLSGKATKYTYDKANWLTNVVSDGGGRTYTYGYDARGNRKTSSDGTTDQSLAYDAVNQITPTGHTYDAAGRHRSSEHAPDRDGPAGAVASPR
ncbi:hypothetical protein [Streptomyces sp. NPDC007088]|uniref:hypothetical protein n=1 Tax=Streptomyces sp. NPDC007088 TaxID=3364773 RepID=UPI00368693C5